MAPTSSLKQHNSQVHQQLQKHRQVHQQLQKHRQVQQQRNKNTATTAATASTTSLYNTNDGSNNSRIIHLGLVKRLEM